MANKNENIDLGKILPNIIEAEEAVLGCVLIDSEAMSKAMQLLNKDDFYKTANAIIFDAMLTLFEKNHQIDYVTIIEQLKKNKLLKDVGDAYYITGLTEKAPSAHNIEYYAKLVKEKSILRNIINVSRSLTTEAYESKEDITEILDNAEQALFSLSKDADNKRFKNIEPILHDVLDNWGNRKEGALTGVPSSFFELDNLLSGFQKSDLIILAGRPSMGKTALALNFSRNISVDHNMKVGFFSLEMSSKQLVERLITSESEVDSHLVRTGKLPKNEWKKLSEGASVLSEANFYIDDSADLNIMELRAKARQLKAEKDIDILFIDYIQLLHAAQKLESRQQEISYISRSLKALAKELDIPIVALSQLSRAVETRTDHRPIMSDLRESGAIEQDADVVMFIYRKYVYSNSEEDAGLGEIIIAKHRNGPIGNVKISFIDRYARFGNLDLVHSEYQMPS
ncbi:MAG: replicative DNA helicase [Candidatus Marinimicrobia bacterium]|nr:replicative DNA helicase [Candidatus Neomarinimicrobiota bacterium]|tara:strand:- start:13090 stop:14451 length:1362 start_codon:yes stop_codon:yes gene_type:complete